MAAVLIGPTTKTTTTTREGVSAVEMFIRAGSITETQRFCLNLTAAQFLFLCGVV
jgi:hypothetical protein